jgi:hypothetical protein
MPPWTNDKWWYFILAVGREVIFFTILFPRITVIAYCTQIHHHHHHHWHGQPFVSPGLPQNYSPFFPIVGLSGYSFFKFLNNLIFTV